MLRSIPLLLLAAAPTVIAQRYDGQYWPCNPTKNATGACKPNPGWPALNYYVDFTRLTALPSKWTVADYETVTFGPNGAEFTLAKQGDAPQMWTDFYMLGAKYEIVMKIAPGTGVISSSVLMSVDFDEIDIECSGSYFGFNDTEGITQNNWFGKGITGAYDRGMWVDTAKHPETEFHTYSVDWNQERIIWGIDGKDIRTVWAKDGDKDTHQYPQSPSKLQIGLWDGGAPNSDPGTADWAGGRTDMSKLPYTFYVKSVSITNYNPAAAYNWTDQSGHWDSIQLIQNPGYVDYWSSESASSTPSKASSTSVGKATTTSSSTTPSSTIPSSTTTSSTTTSSSASSTASAVSSSTIQSPSSSSISSSVAASSKTSTVIRTSRATITRTVPASTSSRQPSTSPSPPTSTSTVPLSTSKLTSTPTSCSTITSTIPSSTGSNSTATSAGAAQRTRTPQTSSPSPSCPSSSDISIKAYIITSSSSSSNSTYSSSSSTNRNTIPNYIAIARPSPSPSSNTQASPSSTIITTTILSTATTTLTTHSQTTTLTQTLTSHRTLTVSLAPASTVSHGLGGPVAIGGAMNSSPSPSPSPSFCDAVTMTITATAWITTAEANAMNAMNANVLNAIDEDEDATSTTIDSSTPSTPSATLSVASANMTSKSADNSSSPASAIGNSTNYLVATATTTATAKKKVLGDLYKYVKGLVWNWVGVGKGLNDTVREAMEGQFEEKWNETEKKIL